MREQLLSKDIALGEWFIESLANERTNRNVVERRMETIWQRKSTLWLVNDAIETMKIEEQLKKRGGPYLKDL